jgi:hypothetical protein
MGRESKELTEARRLLARAEAELGSADGLACLADGLALLDDIVAAGSPAEAAVARNLASAYAGRLCAKVDGWLADPYLPEPRLELAFKLLTAFDAFVQALPQAARETKIEVARRLIDRYYEGHSPERKRQAFRELAKLADGGE